MCGIAGKASVRGHVERDLVERMCKVVEHRGPDSRGIHLDEGVGLGVQRLSIIDLETGDQPIYNEDRDVVVVLNGEIYNYRELRAELVRRGHTFSTQSDTEVIVHLYEDHGDDCVARLRGMFAFALWDSSERRLLLARDRIGKKPLFYASIDGSLSFASETKSILQDEEVPRKVDLDAIDAFLHFQYVPQPLSAFAHVRKLPPAHILVWKDGSSALRRYWRLAFEPKLDVHSHDDVHELIRTRLLEATSLRLRADVPVGAFLSGGVDSSAVVAAMAQTSASRIATFAIGFSSDRFDERRFAREVADLYGTEHHEFVVEPSAIELIPRLAWHYGEPYADQSAIPSFYLAEATRRHVTVALNGDGGDENFAGYRRYIGNLVAGRLDVIPRRVAAAAASVGARIEGGARLDSARQRARRLLQSLPLSPGDRYLNWMATFTEPERRALYTPDLEGAVDQTAGRSSASGALATTDAVAPLDRLLDIDVHSYLPDDLLVKMDIASMAHSLEVRSPMLDHIFMETVARLPAGLKLDRHTTKKVFKDTLRPWLPDHILDRPKHGFGVPMADWLRGELRGLPADVLLDPCAVSRGLFRPHYVQQLIDDHTTGRFDNSKKLWSLIQLEIWFQTYVDRQPDGPVALTFQAPRSVTAHAGRSAIQHPG
jgi:asparagine synthase (glutamine-hydrolysing)